MSASYHGLIVIDPYALIIGFKYSFISCGKLYIEACEFSTWNPSLLVKRENFYARLLLNKTHEIFENIVWY